MARVDISILREIVRVVEALAKVPEYVTVSKRRFHLTYLEDHRQRIEEALRRHDRNQLNMLFGQLASKVKYQATRMAAAAAAAAPTSKSKAEPAPAAKTTEHKAAGRKVATVATQKVAAKKVATQKPVSQKPVAAKAAGSASKKKK